MIMHKFFCTGISLKTEEEGGHLTCRLTLYSSMYLIALIEILLRRHVCHLLSGLQQA